MSRRVGVPTNLAPGAVIAVDTGCRWSKRELNRTPAAGEYNERQSLEENKQPE